MLSNFDFKLELKNLIKLYAFVRSVMD